MRLAGERSSKILAARRATLLVAFSLLTLAATGNAEGKWVLWHGMSGAAPILPKNLHEWRGGESFTTEADCEREVRDSLAKIAKSEPMPPPLRSELTIRGNVASLTLYRGNDLVSTQSIRMVCLPDTVDPRATKGK
jgi:hypothetical protein